MTPDEFKDRWKPVRAGERFCSPACGRGCTWQQYNEAMRASRALCRRLGSGWTPHVWENLGWHYEACRRNVSVRPSGEKGVYCATVDREFNSCALSPHAALHDCAKQIERSIAHLTTLLRAVKR